MICDSLLGLKKVDKSIDFNANLAFLNLIVLTSA